MPTQRFRILHLSDLHIVSDAKATRCEAPHGARGNGDLLRRLSGLTARLAAADVIVISGDITDSGARLEWQEFRSIWNTLPPYARSRIFAVPGNHDLNHVASENFVATTDTSDYAGRALRSRLSAQAIRDIQGSRCEVPTIDDTGAVGFRRLDEFVSAFADDELDDMLPYVWPVTSEDGWRVALIGINTVGVGLTVLDNAMGALQTGKIMRVVSTMEKAGYFPVIVGHHHLLPIPGEVASPRAWRQWLHSYWRLAKHIFIDSVDGVRLLSALRNYVVGDGAAYLHGHRHVTRAMCADRVHVLGAPSLQFGDEHTGCTESTAVMHEFMRHQPTGFRARPTVEVRTSVLRPGAEPISAQGA
jgi:3',5'-cyclic AMP phosphodiesterase CpdA